MKKRLKEKQLKKRMVTAKKGVVVATTALILSNSPVAVITAFAEGQTNVHQEAEKAIEEKSTIDQGIYGNILENATITGDPVQGIIPEWIPSYATAIDSAGNTTYANTTYSFENNKYHLKGAKAYISYTDLNEPVLNTGYVGNATAPASYIWLFTESQKSNVIANRTYKGSLHLKKNTGDVILILNSGNNISGSTTAWISPGENKELVAEVKGMKDNSIGFNFTARGGNVTFDRDKIFLGLKYADQWKQVDALFTSLDQTELAPGVTKDTINQARAMVNSITDNKDATEMNEALAKADALYEKNIADALDSVLNNGQLAPGTSQEDIDNLQDLINQLPDGEKKQELQDKLNQAQELLTNQQNAQTAVDNLFDNGQLKPTVSQSDIDQAQQLIDKLPEGEKKQELQGKLDQAKEQFKQLQAAIQSAQTAVDNLFNNGQLIPNITQEAIDQAQELVNKLPEGEKKQELQGKLDQAKEQFNHQQAAQTAVDKLFGANGQLAPNVTQEMIKEAQELLNKVPDGNKKQELQTKLDKAQKLYNQQVLVEVTVMVNGWFTDASHTSLKEGVTTDDIERAIELLGQLPESSETDKLA
ncbi:toxin Cry1Ac domain D-VI-related protein, partial [Enterococcus faecalis]|uniref:toxin Cry1Ac domain D-VI-related protein n=1 Tax=Enterococcus faecalis TaxID=1351 RepID=UPI002362F825